MDSSVYTESIDRESDVSLFSTVLTTLFTRFDQQKVGYCLLRNFESLPDNADGDIDILVRQADIQKVDAILRTLSEDFSLMMRKIERNGHLLVHLVAVEELRRAISENRPATEILLDFQTQLQWMGMPYMDPEAILSDRQRYRAAERRERFPPHTT